MSIHIIEVVTPTDVPKLEINAIVGGTVNMNIISSTPFEVWVICNRYVLVGTRVCLSRYKGIS